MNFKPELTRAGFTAITLFDHGFSNNSSLPVAASYSLTDKVDDDKVSSGKIDFVVNVSF